ncbi:MAG: aminotransferase class III-fold pyridoxal phosphate-dependent enzyme, partial [Verrucomicrobia bacterium]|nr:aminotransferase class III-fold pyridoxal phosphate-dependent enzyme [Verrucomicrobiota bacterium]
SIWTNLHGHNHPGINAAIRRQLSKIAHSSALGLANEPASLLAAGLLRAANKIGDGSLEDAGRRRQAAALQNRRLEKVFYSDDGSTAVEAALKMAYQTVRRERGGRARPKFVSMQGAYHGDTVGAVSLGHIDLFHGAYGGLLFKSDAIMPPYCYRCPFNRAKPGRDDARNWRKCNWECVGQAARKFSAQKKRGNPYAAFVYEPGMQGAAGMIPQPPGWLKQVADMAREHGTLLIADEVMTGFGRCGGGVRGSLFASHREHVQPDFLCLAKGMTGGYLPMAATLTTRRIFDAFLGDYDEFKTFFHGHSYTGNQLGAAASLASLEILASHPSARARQTLEMNLREALEPLWLLPNVGDIRRTGLAAGIELVKDWRTREPFDLRRRAGIRVCEALARRGVLTRPIGNVIVIMPPYCTTAAQVGKMITALGDAIREVLGR